jgi:hypothetical protein
MLFKTTQTKETEIDIPVPSYWREISTHPTYIAVTAKENVVEAYHTDSYSVVSKSTVAIRKDAIVNAYLNWMPITEEEFIKNLYIAINNIKN